MNNSVANHKDNLVRISLTILCLFQCIVTIAAPSDHGRDLDSYSGTSPIITVIGIIIIIFLGLILMFAKEK